MKRTIGWLLLLTIIVLYSLLVYSWWEEGNRNWYGVKLLNDTGTTPTNRSSGADR